ncbi:hypothetical protein MVEN_01875900 [Mycena venus]|uniref:Uncharacterized protein n=1 Tax=Mycena venus TaxID=2733690 RepID=A0A8H6XJ09_9AGAR|nr:hypothetical protein MVEN_01875900 [Mycena venus]
MSSDFNSTLPAPLSDADALILKRYGRDIMQDTLGMIVESICCSAYGIFFAFAVNSILRTSWSRGKIVMLLVVIYLYASSVIQLGLDFATLFKNIHYLLMVPEIPIPDRALLADENLGFFPALEALFVFNMIVGDGVVIWRAWAIHQRRMLAILFPCFLLLVCFIFSVIDIVCFSYEGLLPGGEQICPQASLIAWTFSVGTNVLCTILIGRKALQHRKMMRALNVHRKSRMSTEKVLSILVESGFIYSLLWLSTVVAYIPAITRDTPWYYVYEVLQPISTQIAGMYPTVVIVIVNLQRTIWEEIPATITTGGTAQWGSSAKKSGQTDTFDTQRGVDIHLETVVEITREGSLSN